MYFVSALAICILGLILLLRSKKRKGRYDQLPPGSLGHPIIGETIRFLRAFKSNKIDEFMSQRVGAYGPVFRTCLFGQRTVVLTGATGNRFWLFNDGKLFHGNPRGPHRAIIGTQSLLDKNGEEHKRMAVALMKFFAPDELKKLVGRLDFVIRRHLYDHWRGKDEISAVPVMKFQTFSVTCNMLFQLQNKEEVMELFEYFKVATEGIYSLPIRLPGSRLHRALKARSQIDRILSSVIKQRKNDVLAGRVSPDRDLLSCLLCNKDEAPLSDQELKDNIVLFIIAGHETTAMLLVLMCKFLAANPHCFEEIAKESRDIDSEELTWKDVQRMKYLWNVAQETLRIIPPISGIFRKAATDINYEGYTIPNGWALYWSSYSTVYCEEIFHEPHKFDPSRFDGSRTIPPYTFLPFGGGPRICPANEYARLEIVITMHHLVKRYRWRAIIPDEPIIRNPLCAPSMGLPLTLFPLETTSTHAS
ncbi:hypothetical protein SUGI_0416090 [Cryptomeria japonica]|uniref:cytochrome P450 716B2 n=1 Tax=Cryptomeria japonica TaxID=3369 RepID=UPI002408E37E|nr:cytochrome P450 716B2 [Cryptomeria japonica]GLJ22152.1 hypothetical protein SUGI_0416090 [Cryptomeria japonica]